MHARQHVSLLVEEHRGAVAARGKRVGKLAGESCHIRTESWVCFAHEVQRRHSDRWEGAAHAHVQPLPRHPAHIQKPSDRRLGCCRDRRGNQCTLRESPDPVHRRMRPHHLPYMPQRLAQRGFIGRPAPRVVLRQSTNQSSNQSRNQPAQRVVLRQWTAVLGYFVWYLKPYPSFDPSPRHTVAVAILGIQ
jgi:hypothetical protein